MTTRTITKYQFSPDTTIDGNRIELSLQDIQDRYNSPEFRDIDMWSENKYHYGFTPLNINGVPNLVPYKQGSPFNWGIESQMYPSVPNYEGPNNEFRLKGAALVDPDTGIPRFATNSFVPTDLSFFWTATQYFTKPTILQDWTIFGFYDDKFGAAPTSNNKWYGNEWVYYDETSETIIWTDKYVCWIVVDNPQDTGNTFIRNSEIHSWAASSEGLTMGINQNIYNGTTGYSDETLQYNPSLAGPTEQKINGNAVRFHNLNIPVFAGSRVRFIFGLPANIKYEPEENQYVGNAAELPYYPDIGTNSGNVWATGRNTTYQNNLWNMSIHCLEPLEKIRNV